jgi:hypothetical protein
MTQSNVAFRIRRDLHVVAKIDIYSESLKDARFASNLSLASWRLGHINSEERNPHA